MKASLPAKFWIQSVLAWASASCLVLTVFEPDWIEQFFGFEPDGGDGSAEWGLTLALLLATCAFVALAGRTWRMHKAP